MASTDQGTSINYDGEKLVTPAQYTGNPQQKNGSYGIIVVGFTFPNDRDTELGSTFLSKTSIPSPLPFASNLLAYYKMVGYYVTGGIYESFVVIGAPSLATTVNPNTGHTLTNTYVSAVWSIT
jgi:hypothetical protein